MAEEQKPHIMEFKPKAVEPNEYLESVPAGPEAELERIKTEFAEAAGRYMKAIGRAATGTEQLCAQLMKSVEVKLAELKTLARYHKLDDAGIVKEAIDAIAPQVRQIIVATAAEVLDHTNGQPVEQALISVLEYLRALEPKLPEGSYLRSSLQPWWIAATTGFQALSECMQIFVKLGEAAGVSKDDMRQILNGVGAISDEWIHHIADGTYIQPNEHSLRVAAEVEGKFVELKQQGMPDNIAVITAVRYAAQLPVDCACTEHK